MGRTSSSTNVGTNTQDFPRKSRMERVGKLAIHSEDPVLLLQKWQALLTSEEPGEMEARLRRHDGVFRWFLMRVEPLRDEAGNDCQMVWNMHRY